MSKSRNFGLSRNMTVAASMLMNVIVRQRGCSFSTAAKITQRVGLFVSYLKEKAVTNSKGELVNRFERVDAETLRGYGQQLAEAVRHGDMKVATAQNYVSAVNTVMKHFEQRGSRHWVSVSPTKDVEHGGCGIGERSALRNTAPISRLDAMHAIESIRETEPRVAAMGELCLTLGLRAQEAATLRIATAIRDAELRNEIRIDHGTKGGQPRVVHLSAMTDERKEAVLEALHHAQAAMNPRDYALIPWDSDYRSFLPREESLREALKAYGGDTVRIHDLRARFACDWYRDRSGLIPTCEKPTEHQSDRLTKDDRQLDRATRLELSEELGHHRMDVTTEYIGGMR